MIKKKQTLALYLEQNMLFADYYDCYDNYDFILSYFEEAVETTEEQIFIDDQYVTTQEDYMGDWDGLSYCNLFDNGDMWNMTKIYE